MAYIDTKHGFFVGFRQKVTVFFYALRIRCSSFSIAKRVMLLYNWYKDARFTLAPTYKQTKENPHKWKTFTPKAFVT